jgi:hypothetical protein
LRTISARGPVWNDNDMLIVVTFVGPGQECGEDSIQNNVQAEITRIKLCSHNISNCVHTMPGSLGAMLIVDDGKGGMVTESPTNSEWFK